MLPPLGDKRLRASDDARRQVAGRANQERMEVNDAAERAVSPNLSPPRTREIKGIIARLE
jgi:hypothetical protein